MKRFSLLKTVILGAGLSLALTSASIADKLGDIKSAGKMTFGTEMQYAPFDLLIDGKYAGLCKDLADAVAADLGVKPEYQDLPWASVLPGLEVGKFDMVNAPVTITAERLERYLFTLPIADASVGLLRLASDDSIKKPGDIAGKIVGSQKGSAQLEQLKAFGATLEGGVDIREYSSADEAYADLAAGRLNAVANSFPNIGYLASKRPETFAVVTSVFGKKKYFGWVVVKNAENESLIARINEILLAMQDDGRMAKIHEKWLGSYVPLPREAPMP